MLLAKAPLNYKLHCVTLDSEQKMATDVHSSILEKLRELFILLYDEELQDINKIGGSGMVPVGCVKTGEIEPDMDEIHNKFKLETGLSNDGSAFNFGSFTEKKPLEVNRYLSVMVEEVTATRILQGNVDEIMTVDGGGRMFQPHGLDYFTRQRLPEATDYILSMHSGTARMM